MIEFSPVCVIRHFFLIPLRWRIRQILLYHIWATLQKACFVSHPRSFFATLTWVQTGFIISLRFFQIISVLLCFILKISTWNSRKRRYQHEIADCKWQWIKKYFVMDLAENVLYHETFFHKTINHSVEFRCCTLQSYDFSLQWINGIVGLCKILSCFKI